VYFSPSQGNSVASLEQTLAGSFTINNTCKTHNRDRKFSPTITCNHNQNTDRIKCNHTTPVIKHRLIAHQNQSVVSNPNQNPVDLKPTLYKPQTTSNIQTGANLHKEETEPQRTNLYTNNRRSQRQDRVKQSTDSRKPERRNKVASLSLFLIRRSKALEFGFEISKVRN